MDNPIGKHTYVVRTEKDIHLNCPFNLGLSNCAPSNTLASFFLCYIYVQILSTKTSAIFSEPAVKMFDVLSLDDISKLVPN